MKGGQILFLQNEPNFRNNINESTGNKIDQGAIDGDAG
jgi:hypothetical protein